MAESRIVVKMTEIEPVKRALDEAAHAVNTMRALLTALTDDEWAGWGADEYEHGDLCSYCHGYTVAESGGYHHLPGCPLTKARVLLGTQPDETEEA